MKRFIVSVLCVSVFFIGLGGLVDSVGARFKSDDKALNLLRQARSAIGGDSAVGNIKSMTITGKMTKTFEIDGAARSEQGDSEINLQLPNQFSRMMKLRTDGGNGTGETQIVDKKVDVVVVGKGDNLKWKTENPDGLETGAVIIKRGDGEGSKEFTVTQDGEKNGELRKIVKDDKFGEEFRRNEFVRTTLSLLLTAPEGVDVSYIYAGEGSVDGNSVDIIDAQLGGASIKLYLDKSSHLVRMMTYQGYKPFIIRINKDEAKPDANGDTKIFERRLPEPEMAEFQVKFSDYRSVSGLQMPFRWTQTVGGKTDETLEISSYEINPPNIAEKFKELPTKIMMRTQKPQ